MKLLSGEKIQRLEFPRVLKPTFVKRVVYKSDQSHVHGDNSSSQQLVAQGTRFNLFTGNQTFEEREESFKVIVYAYTNSHSTDFSLNLTSSLVLYIKLSFL